MLATSVSAEFRGEVASLHEAVAVEASKLNKDKSRTASHAV